MSIDQDERKRVLLASSRNSEFGSRLVGRLLTDVEIEETSGGGNGDCDGGGYYQSGGSFTQNGGGYNQDGGTYSMSCPNPKIEN